ncbi:MAG: hypothetical protein ACRDRO_04675 [Pseudonocardiaceae bacterium]
MRCPAGLGFQARPVADSSVLAAVAALREAGVNVAGVATVTNCDTGAREATGLPYRTAL